LQIFNSDYYPKSSSISVAPELSYNDYLLNSLTMIKYIGITV